MVPDTKRHIDNARQILVGVVPNPISQVDQITYALIYKFMDDMDQSALKEGGEASFFTGDLEHYSWSHLLSPRIGNQERLNLYVEAFNRFAQAPQLPELFREILKNAYLPYRSPEVLGLFLKEIEYFDYSHPEELGNAYEYLLSIMGSQGDAGQFRTPRHLIDFIVDVIQPTEKDKILDPACGTGGFLVKAYQHILAQHVGEKRLTPSQKQELMDQIEGYDIDPGMVRIAQVNMFLHQFKNPKIYQYDTLSMDERWRNKFDVIMANPPFMSPKGGIKPHNKFSVKSTRSEVLFVDYIMNHLKPKGRAGIIVPEGIIFQSGKAYKQLRKNLVQDGLYAVVSLPSGIFQPYSGVKTSVLLFDNDLARQSKELLFVKVEADGYDLGAQRRRISKNDLPKALEIIRQWQKGKKTEHPLALFVEKSKIAENGDYNLSGDRYRVTIDYSNAKWPMVKLGEVCEILDSKRKPITKSERKAGIYPYYGATGILDYISDFIFNEKLVLIGEDGAKWQSGDRTAFIANGKYWVNNHAHVLRPDRRMIFDEIIVGLINAMDLTPFVTGITVPKLNQEKLKSIQIPLPPLEIQEQIVAEIDGYQNIIQGAQQIVKNWKPTIDIDPAWPKVQLGKVATIIAGQSPEGKYYNNNGEGLPFYQGKTEFQDKYMGKPVKWTTRVTKEALRGDILMSVRAPVGPVNISTETICIGRGLAAIRPSSEILLNFLFSLLQNMQNDIVGNQGAAFASISRSDLEKIQILLPPLEIQQQIVEKIEAERTLVESAKKLIQIYEQKIKTTLDKLWKN